MRVGENLCPGIFHAVPAKDGMLIRIRIPAGLISAPQLSAVATLSAAFADGQVEITSRGNLQLRAIEERSLPEVVAKLTSMELLPSQQHDRVRNISSSPLAGLDPDEFVDTRPLVRKLDKHLIADEAFIHLHPKFSFGIYGGGSLFSHEQDDLALHAIRDAGPNQSARFQLFIGGADTGSAVGRDEAVDSLLLAATLCIQTAEQYGLPVRCKRLAATPGVMDHILQTLSPFLAPSAHFCLPRKVALAPIGIHPSAQSCERNFIPGVPLGRLTSDQAEDLSQLATASRGDLRLAPWRGIVLGGVPLTNVTSVVTRLNSIGLYLDGRDGFHGIAACAGNAGCDASLADVRGDAAMLAQRLTGHALLTGWTVNLAGCEKQCAMRHGATIELIGTSSGYLVRMDGMPAYESCSSEAALNLIAASHSRFASEGTSS